MKNEELLADAIGGLDEELLLSVNRKRDMEDTNKLVVVKDETKTEAKRSFRKISMPLTACLVLLLAFAVAGATALVRGLNIGQTDEGEKTVEYVPDSYETVPLSELTGDVVNTPATMKARLIPYLAGEAVPVDGMEGMFIVETDAEGQDHTHIIGSEDDVDTFKVYSFNVGLPGNLYKAFETYDAAEAYIGYAGIHMPRLSRATEQLGVFTTGLMDGGYMSANADSTFQLLTTGIYAGYKISNTCTAVSAASIQFGDQYQSGPTIYKDSQNSTFTQETRTVGAREFSILRIDGAEGLNDVVKVFWSENKVEYRLEIFYTPDDEAAVEALITEWMNAFPS